MSVQNLSKLPSFMSSPHSVLLEVCKEFHQAAQRQEKFFAVANSLRHKNELNPALDREALSVVEEYTLALKHVMLLPARTLEELSAKAGVLHVAKRLELEGANGDMDAAEDEDFLALSLAEDCMMLLRRSRLDAGQAAQQAA